MNISDLLFIISIGVSGGFIAYTACLTTVNAFKLEELKSEIDKLKGEQS